MVQKVKRFFQSYASTPVVLALIVLISYALTVPFIGYFMDDWYLMWFKHVFGAWQFPAYFSIDRPLMGYFYILANFLLGNSESPLAWQIFGLFTRWLVAFSLWGFLNTLWPNAKKQNTLVAALAAVFPGFTQQWIAAIYSFFFSCLAGFFFSLTLMLKAVRQPKRFWLYTAFSFVIGMYCVAASEFYFGLELIRPVVLWIEFSRNKGPFSSRLKQVFTKWLPYLAALIAFGVWRGFFFNSQNHSVKVTSLIAQSPLSFLLDSIKKVYQAVVDSIFNSWVNPFNLSNYPEKGKIPLLILAAVLIVFVGVLLWFKYLFKEEFSDEGTNEKQWEKEAFWLGLISLCVAILPFLAADMPVSTAYPFDRFLLAYLFGSCLLVVLLADKKKVGIYFIALLLAVSSGYQITKSIYYKNIYQQQSDLFWQLSWRAPQIEKNTIVLTEDLPFSELYSSGSLTAPLNLIYDPGLTDGNIAYAFVQAYQHADILTSYDPGQPISYHIRSFFFTGNTSQMIVIKKPAEGCLRVVTANDYIDPTMKEESLNFWKSASPLSNLDRILPVTDTPAVLPEKYFGKENTDQWCYYFEKADLARQQSQWQSVIDLFAQADAKGFKPLNAYEWVPLIEAYVSTDQVQKASDITNTLKLSDETTKGIACNTWQNLAAANTAASQTDSIAAVLSNLQCKIK